MNKPQVKQSWEITHSQWIKADLSDPRKLPELVTDFALEVADEKIRTYKVALRNNNRLLITLSNDPCVQKDQKAYIRDLIASNEALLKELEVVNA